MEVKHPFLPIYDANSEVLILGSFPSVISRENDFYYGNPKNRFWAVFDVLLGNCISQLSNENKTSELLKHHIALYDVVYSCNIVGSDDRTISDVIYTDIPKLLNESKIRRIYCNGKKAYNLFIKKYPEYLDITKYLPSTSPANAVCKLDMLIEKWKIILN